MDFTAEHLFRGLEMVSNFSKQDKSYGEPFDEEDEDDRRYERATYGEPLVFDDGDDHGQGASVMEIDERSWGEPLSRPVPADRDENYGGLMDDVRTIVRQVVSPITREITREVNKKVNHTNSRVTNNRKALQGLNKQIKRLGRMNRKVRNKVRAGKHDMWINAALASAAAMPGILAYKGLTGDDYKAERAAQVALDAAIQKITIGAALAQASLTDQTGTYSETDLNNSFEALQEKQAEIITAFNLLKTELDAIRTAAEAHETSVVKLDTTFIKSTLIQLLGYLPTQKTNEKQAFYEFLIKFFVGNLSGASGGGSFSLTF